MDTYAAGGSDPRPALAIAQACKAAASGGPLFRPCGHGACAAVEAAPRAFKACGRCGVAAYCSPGCQRAAWKGRHKRECGTDAAEPRLPSEAACTRVWEAVSAEMTARLVAPGGAPDREMIRAGVRKNLARESLLQAAG